MPTKPKTRERQIFDQNYYKARVMIRDPWFIKKVKWLRERLAAAGCPLPRRPFKTGKQYMAWNTRFGKRYGALMRSSKYKERVQQIAGGKETISLDVYRKLENFKDEFLPPLYGRVFDEILEHFGIDRDHEGFKDFLLSYPFFGRREFETSPFSIVWRRNEKTNEAELFIQIFGHTKKADLVQFWNEIAKEQKNLKDFIGKSKQWKSFERDIAIYKLSKELKDPKIKRRLNSNAIDTTVWVRQQKKWPKLSTNSIRAAITRTARRLGKM